MCSSYSTPPASGRPVHASSVHAKVSAEYSADASCTPSGCRGERGSGITASSSSRTKPYRAPSAAGTSALHHPSFSVIGCRSPSRCSRTRSGVGAQTANVRGPVVREAARTGVLMDASLPSSRATDTGPAGELHHTRVVGFCRGGRGECMLVVWTTTCTPGPTTSTSSRCSRSARWYFRGTTCRCTCSSPATARWCSTAWTPSRTSGWRSSSGATRSAAGTCAVWPRCRPGSTAPSPHRTDASCSSAAESTGSACWSGCRTIRTRGRVSPPGPISRRATSRWTRCTTSCRSAPTGCSRS